MSAELTPPPEREGVQPRVQPGGLATNPDPGGLTLERRRRRWGWPVALVLVLVVVLGLRLFQQLAAPGEQATAGWGDAGLHAGRQAASGASGSDSRSHESAVETSPQLANATQTAVRVARAASAALAAVTQRAAVKLPSERSLELCGLGRLIVDLPPPLPGATLGGVAQAGAADAVPPPLWTPPAGLPPALGQQARAAAWPELLAAMEAAGQPLRSRAAAQLLRAAGVVAADSLPLGTPESAVPNEAAASAAQLGRAAVGVQTSARTTAQTTAQTHAVAALARLARPVVRVAGQQQQGDATVLRWALAMCARQARPVAECQRIGARDLVRLAPEDSASWLALAARPGLPAAERQKALQRAAAAPQFTGLGGALAVQVDAAWPEQRPGYVQVQVLALALAVEATLDDSTVPAVLQVCSAQVLAAPVAEGSAHAPCEAMGRRARANGPDLEWLAAAAVLGQRLGWPEAERGKLRDEAAALAALQVAPQAVAEQPLSCPALAWKRSRLQRFAAQGGLTLLRQQRAVPAAQGNTGAGTGQSGSADAGVPGAR